MVFEAKLKKTLTFLAILSALVRFDVVRGHFVLKCFSVSIEAYLLVVMTTSDVCNVMVIAKTLVVCMRSEDAA